MDILKQADASVKQLDDYLCDEVLLVEEAANLSKLIKALADELRGTEKKNELIVKQQLEIEALKQQETDFYSRMLSIYGELYNIGAPLNDNIDGFTAKQKKVFHRIGTQILLNDEEF